MSTSNSYRALIIDDDPAMHLVFKEMLSILPEPETGPKGLVTSGASALHSNFPTFEIDSAYQGEEGLECVRDALQAERPYAMAFVDMRMPPGWDGLETICRLWRQSFDLQIIICTGQSDLSWHELTGRFGHNDRLLVLKKPFDMVELRQIACSLAEKWNLTYQVRSHLERLQRLVTERTEKLQKANLSLQQKIVQNQQAERRLVTQYDVSRALVEAESLPDVVQRILHIVGENLTWHWGAFWQLNAESSAVQLTASWQQSGGAFEIFLSASSQGGFASGCDLPGRVWATGQAAWLNDFFQEPEFPRSKAASTDGLHSAVAFPVWTESRFFGVMEFASREILARDPYQLQTFAVLGSAIGQFIQRNQAEAERNQMETQLRHAQKMESIGQLAAGIAHEINTPTQYIGDNVRFLQSSFDDLKLAHEQYGRLLQAAKNNALTPEITSETEAAIQRSDVEFLLGEIPNAIQQTLEGVDRVTRIVRAMRDFSHPGTGEKTPVDLNRALETTLTVARAEWKYVATVVTEFDSKLPPVPCLPGELSQVFLNLIVNAAHAITDMVAEDGREKGVITVSTHAGGDWAEIRIRDTGSGIPEKIQHQIFDPFFTTKPVGKGTGQGLAIAHSVVVEQHGGTLTFETEPGKGTVFLIRLPFQASAGPKRKTKSPRIANHETNFIRR